MPSPLPMSPALTRTGPPGAAPLVGRRVVAVEGAATRAPRQRQDVRRHPGLSGEIDDLRRLILEGARSPEIRAVALAATAAVRRDASGHPDRRDVDALAAAIHDYVRTHIEYVRDATGVEMLNTPRLTHELRSGDCDDHTTLSGAMLAALAVPIRLRVVGTTAPSHVFLEVKRRDGAWRPFDTTTPDAERRFARRFPFDQTFALRGDTDPMGYVLSDLGLLPQDGSIAHLDDRYRVADTSPSDYVPQTMHSGGIRFGLPYERPSGENDKRLPSGGINPNPVPTDAASLTGGTVERVTDVLDTVDDILDRVRGAWRGATGQGALPVPSSMPPPAGIPPVMLLGGAALALWFVTKKR